MTTAIISALLLAADVSTAALDEAVKKFTAVLGAVEEHAADGVEPNAALYGGAIPGMLRGLDPHSIFLDPDQFQQLKEMNNSERKGFGSIVSILPGRVFVLQTMPGTPSSRSGLSPGDEIVAVNGYPLMGLEPEQLVQLLSESRRREAKIGVRRVSSPRILEFTLIPENLASPSVDRAFEIEPRIGYVRVSNFEIKTAKELRDAIEKLGGAKLEGLILDLRNNPGGVVEAALESAAMFLKPGQRILTARGRSKKEDSIDVPAGNVPYEFPVAALINEKTASAAEIVASALQDHKRAKIVGARSFGKGLVQSVYNLSSNTGVALTVAYYYSPLGRNLQRPLANVRIETPSDAGGIAPDIAAGPEPMSRLRIALDSSGAFPSFATEALRKGAKSATGSVMDDFKIWLAERRIQPGVAEWSADGAWIRSRLEQEMLNQTAGVEKGDEVELRRDPACQRSLDALRQSR
ncbi:MAG: S41 family peptidase [Bryobacteraceae bacterium]|nr:S41 family peptidase [Bryobacteraceae bacterium]